jgi:hypothetical protein
MSQIVTPPDIVIKDTVYLVVNAAAWDVEMITRWLQVNKKSYTIHLYHEGMKDSAWLYRVAANSKLVIINRKQTSDLNVALILKKKKN